MDETLLGGTVGTDLRGSEPLKSRAEHCARLTPTPRR